MHFSFTVARLSITAMIFTLLMQFCSEAFSFYGYLWLSHTVDTMVIITAIFSEHTIPILPITKIYFSFIVAQLSVTAITFTLLMQFCSKEFSFMITMVKVVTQVCARCACS